MPGIAVIARQRSGTNYLRSLIADSSNLVNLSEVFDYNARDANENFFRFRALDGYQWSPHREASEVVMELSRFLGFLTEKHAHHIIDIKYNQTLVSIPTYMSPASLLPLFSALQQHRYCLVHLVRENVCASIVSGLVADVTGTFHVPRDRRETAPHTRIRLNARQFIAEVEAREREIAMFDHLCRWMGNNVRLSYEEIASAPPAKLRVTIESLVRRGEGTFVRLGESAFRKGLGHWLEHVENRDEIHAAFAADPRLRRYLADQAQARSA